MFGRTKKEYPPWFEKIIENMNFITKRLQLFESLFYFNLDSEQYIPSGVYNKTKNTRLGIF